MYKRFFVDNMSEFEDMITNVKKAKGWLSFDTETTGLHLKKDKPFILTITFEDLSYAIDLEKIEMIHVRRLFDLFDRFEFVIGHNVKYDLHMLKNIGVQYLHNNLSDTMIMARLSLAADETFTLALKSLAKSYLSKDTGDDERQVSKALTALRRERTAKLKTLLREHNLTKKWFDELVKDKLFDLVDLGDFKPIYEEFLVDNPEPNYKDIYLSRFKKVMVEYAMNDTEITLDLAKKMYPVLLAKDQKKTLELENNLIIPLFNMERAGVKIDIDYLEKSKNKLRKYILKQREKLAEILGESIKVGQHKRIKEIFSEKWEVELTSTDDRNLALYEEGDVGNASKLIRELRTLEKWYSTYIERFLDKSSYDGRAYTQFNQAGAVTGRLSSDFQQFPKNPIKDIKGNELFHPRRMIVPSGNGFDNLYFIDYSQIELRVQANYTYEISGGDTNMCRAYMPFQCHNSQKTPFNPKEDSDLIFKETWYQDEDNQVWKPVDLHSATAMKAFPDVDPESPEFKHLRFLGKSTNFAKNYGATTSTLMSQFGFDQKTAERLNQGYYSAFPKVLDYQKAVNRAYKRRGYVKNAYGRRYYLDNGRFAYRLYNYIIQGTCADMLKEKIIDIDNLLSKYHSRLQMNIHDELSFEIYKGEEFLIKQIIEIMEDVPYMTIPVVADVDYTETNWAEKKGW